MQSLIVLTLQQQNLRNYNEGTAVLAAVLFIEVVYMVIGICDY